MSKLISIGPLEILHIDTSTISETLLGKEFNSVTKSDDCGSEVQFVTHKIGESSRVVFSRMIKL